MKFEDFRKMMMLKPFFTSQDLSGINPLDNTLKLQLNKWTKKGKIISLKKGMYTLSDIDRQVAVSHYMIANELYSPSYISLEFALSYYQLIPEAVNTFTCITTKKTKTFKNQFGLFTYKSIKKQYYFGFTSVKSPDNHNFFLATPEKAILDFIYYNISPTESDIKKEFLNNYRFQNLDTLNPDRLKEYQTKMQNKRINTAIISLLQLL